MKKLLAILKKIWWIFLLIIGFIAGLIIKNPRKVDDLEKLKQERGELKKEQHSLKKEQERLEKEAEQIEKKKYFNNVDDAAKYLNDVMRKRK
ncbi:hypothetical protein [Thermosipho sp. 1074]|uniref:hypothetical protein n=1 Tax=Thermosipho sp. 1074 TaxID=1643331 RepID=UPI000985B92F|nr:hypothetical protein [Thermosipho sp. 1074]OOC42198.1 hypothetical protein XO08_07915 [Thermosipho sp. 1074]